MQLPKSVRENLIFLLAEINAQVTALEAVLDSGSANLVQRVLDRRGYAYNLKMRIHDDCLEALRQSKKARVDIYSLRGAEAIASGLKRLSDICQDCVHQMGGLKKKDSIRQKTVGTLLRQVSSGIHLIEKAMDSDDSRLGLRVDNMSKKINRDHDRMHRAQMVRLKKTKSPEDLVAILFMLRRIRDMGEVLVDIGEAIVSARMGQPMPMDRFRFLEDALTDLGLRDAAVETIAETKSGSAIAGITANGRNGDAGYAAIFKDGKKGKLADERDGVENWNEVFPGLAPQIFSYKKKGQNASLLIEHLPGLTFEQLLHQDNPEALSKGIKKLTKTLAAVWDETKRKKTEPAGHMAQLRKRLDAVCQVHRDIDAGGVKICGTAVASLEDLIDRAEQLEAKVLPPFSVFIHGDFNLDNIIYDIDSGQIRFIDLHRSRYRDYVQDVAVFMVSNYRLQVFDKRTRDRIHQTVLAFYRSVADYAATNKDHTFNLRLALGLARSFITSTRFILDEGLATSMMLRGIYILERLDGQTKKSAKNFRLPIEELF